MQMRQTYRPTSNRQEQPSEIVDCKFCYITTSYGVPLCGDCYRELGAGE